LDFGIVGVFYAQLVSNIIIAIIGLSFNKNYLVAPRNSIYIKPMLKFGWPYIFPPIFIYLIPLVDRHFITNYLTLEHLGVYAIAHKIANLLRLPIGGFRTAWGPFVFALYKEKEIEKLFQNVLKFYSIFMLFILIMTSLILRQILILFASTKYLDSYIIIPPILFSIFIESLSWISGIGIGLSKKTYLIAISYFIALLASIIAIPLAIDQFGLIGVAYVILLSKIIHTVLITGFANFVYHIKFNFNIIILMMLVAFPVVITNSIILELDIEFAYVLNMLSSFGAMVIIWFLVINKEDRSKVLDFFSKKRKNVRLI